MRGFFSGAKNGMKEFGHTIATLINFVLLSIVYLVGVGITSIVAKIAKKEFLDMKLDKKLDKKTYWTDLDLKNEPIEEYYRQF